MARDLNKVMLTGHLGADPEMKYIQRNGERDPDRQQSAVTTFRVASGRSWKSNDGSQHDETEWFSVVAWDKLAEICNQYLTKGTKVYVEGRLQTRSWDDKDTGEKRYRSEVVAQDMIILSSRSDRQGNGEADINTDEEMRQPARRAPAPQAAPAPSHAPAAPAASRAPAARPAGRNVPQAIENDDDLPF